MKKIILSGIFMFVLVGFVQAETVQIRGNLNIQVCDSDFDGQTVNCDSPVITRPKKIELELKELKNQDPSYKVWKGSWVSIKEKEGQSFHGSIDVSKFVFTSNNNVRYRVGGTIALIPNDGRSVLDEPVSVTFWVSSIDQLNEAALNGNKLFVAKAPLPGGTKPKYYQLTPTLYMGSN